MPADSGTRELPKLQVNVEALVLEDGSRISLSLVETDMTSVGPPYDYLWDGGSPMSLQAVLNTAHPLFVGDESRTAPEIGSCRFDSAVSYRQVRNGRTTLGGGTKRLAPCGTQWFRQGGSK